MLKSNKDPPLIPIAILRRQLNLLSLEGGIWTFGLSGLTAACSTLGVSPETSGKGKRAKKNNG